MTSDAHYTLLQLNQLSLHIKEAIDIYFYLTFTYSFPGKKRKYLFSIVMSFYTIYLSAVLNYVSSKGRVCDA